ncbi:glycoside hydrolase family 99-like domain-containing protein [Alteromonas oceani]|uniref:Glycoside hydrolase family 99-like domain-containing protein n=1 Tax=Alteromonas oceani TaxID=2071609 RepID=A0ABV7K4W6_9ALTE|nr:glycoside hydrolase family 99-like domain-containing protein [Alteromonas oceani]
MDSDQLQEKIDIIELSGLFDFDFYAQQYPDIKQQDAIQHFLSVGASDGASPSYLFDTKWYLQQYSDLAESDLNPLLHYILYGAAELRITSPFVDPMCLENLQAMAEGQLAIAFFYENEKRLSLNINPHFDVSFYISTYNDIDVAGLSPFYHFIYTGVFESRRPKADIEMGEYCELFKVDKKITNPFLHFITHYGKEYLDAKTQIEEVGNVATAEHSVSTAPTADYSAPGPLFETKQFTGESDTNPQVKPLAFYLPQFHPFKENDEWWGKGFTEWRNVVRGKPRFHGHYQPHIPSDLGFYDLRVKEVFKEQAELAKAAGIHGFCFYHYWFNGKRLMEKPIDMFLENKDINISFCLMWANENWTRTWDGFDNDVLIAQDYYEEDDIPFIEDLGRHFKDERYIRVDGRPLFIIYRPGIIPNVKETIKKWRRICEEQLNEMPLFYMAQAFDDTDPRLFDLDGAIEFPPHKIASGLPDASRAEGLIDPTFTGHYPSYDALVSSSLSEKEHPFPLIRGVTPSWDNEARKPGRGMGYVGSTPQKYEKWLKAIAQYARTYPIENKESFVMINAWNEWAEGAHLEPDVYNGHAYLNATYRAVHAIDSFEDKTKLILIGHDAYKHGAQLLTLNIFKTLKQTFGIDVVCVLLEGGPLVEEYKKVGTTHVLDGTEGHFRALIEDLNKSKAYQYAICNTLVSGHCAKILHENNIESIQLVHELSNLIKEYKLEDNAQGVSDYSKAVVFAADFVKRSFNRVVEDANEDKLHIIPQGIYQQLTFDENAKAKLRERLSLSSDAKIVVNTGFADLRKGFDLFISIARKLVKQDPLFHFVWVGNVKQDLAIWLLDSIEPELKEHIHIVPFTKEIALYVQGADCFALTSREDPFPSVVLESLVLGTPVVAFENSGGFEEPISLPVNGELVRVGDIEAFSLAIINQVESDCNMKANKRRDFALQKYDWNNYVFSLLELLIKNLKRVSVVVPNYNYENYLEERLLSIFNQSYPIFEIIVLDDKSPDNSVEVIKHLTDIHKRDIELIINRSNSGSVFKQWAKGVKIATGEYVWIAEADDSASANFLARSMDFEIDVVATYTDSIQIDETGAHLADNYRYYYTPAMLRDMDRGELLSGKEVIKSCLSVNNQFMNVSAMTFRRKEFSDCILQHLDSLLEFKVAGDWFIYVHLLSSDCTIKLIKDSLNVHRRHNKSVTHSNLAGQIKEIESIQVLVTDILGDSSNVSMQKKYIENLKRQVL